MNTAIIVAGGSGTRMNISMRKQYLPLLGIPVLRRTIEKFVACDCINRVCLVVPAEDMSYCKENIIAGLDSDKEVAIVKGGIERQQSVYNGIVWCEGSKKDDILVIHDGVRPLIDHGDIERSVKYAEDYGAAIVAVPAFDTIKKSCAGNYIEKTLNRELIWLAQTPQSFQYDLILKAHNFAIENEICGTDDSSLVELIGETVKIVEGQRRNIKITTKEDMYIAKALIEE